eukprot:1085100-Alexandrium_andersonii.AAC.1
MLTRCHLQGLFRNARHTKIAIAPPEFMADAMAVRPDTDESFAYGQDRFGDGHNDPDQSCGRVGITRKSA